MMTFSRRANSYPPSPNFADSVNCVLDPTSSSYDFSEAVEESSSEGEDEVLWPTNESDSEEDFILVPQSHSRPPPLEEALSRLSVEDSASSFPPTPAVPAPASQSKRLGVNDRAPSEIGGRSLASTVPGPRKEFKCRRNRRKRDALSSYPSPPPSPGHDLDALFTGKDHNIINEEKVRFGACPLVEESDGECHPIFAKYEDAVHFITSFLSNPSPALSCSTYTRLTFLQSLIIELGLMSPSSALPSSLKSAKRLLKARAFVNIGEYLSVREQGLEKLQGIMFRSRRELTSDLRRKKGGRKANRGWVKQHGLNVLLVSVFR